MTSLLGARKRAEEFAAAIDSPGTQPNPASPELRELVDLVGTLRSAPELPRPRPEFTAALREQLVAEAQRSLAEDATLTLHPRRRGARERRLALLASSFVLVGGSAGMAVASQDALPGDALYPIKRGIEKAQADLSRDDAAKGHDLLAQADRRLTEVQGLVGTSAESRVPGTVDDFTSQAQAGSALLLTAFDESQDGDVVVELRSFARDSLATLQEVAASAEGEHQDDLADAAAALLRIDGQATAACPTCAEGEPALEMPPLFLAAEEANRALDATRRAQLGNDHPPLPDAGTKGGQGVPPQGQEQPGQEPPQGTDATDPGKGGGQPQDDGGLLPDDGGLLPDLGGTDKGGQGGGQGDGQGDQGDTGGKQRDRGLLGDVNDGAKQLLPGLDPLLDSLLP